MPTLSVENLCKNFPQRNGTPTPAIANLTLELENEWLVLVGPSGCGKTTLLRLIAGLEKPDRGKILLDGVSFQDLPARDRNVAMVFQTPALFPHLTVFENIAFGLMLRKFPKAEISARVRQAAETLGLTSLLDRKPETLSGGEAQRVALGRALVRQPRIFLLDEPLSNLDAPTRTQLRHEIARLQQMLGVPMIYVTHDQVEALNLGRRIAVMNQGRLQQIGSAAELLENPANDFVRTFFAGVSQNAFVDGR
jgi:multiple sugar transport system ATP-binding protein